MRVQFKLIGILIALLMSSHIWAQEKAKVSDNYKKYGLVESNIPEKWEDGMRTNGEKGTYEWWYFDAHLEDKSTIVIVFYTKNMLAVNKDMAPFANIDITKPDGSKITKNFFCDIDDFYASKDSCYFKIGNSYLKGNLEEYTIHLEDDDMKVDATITRNTNSWRPKTGHMVFGEKENKEFNWVVAVPQGEIDVTYEYNGVKTHQTGSCYHDHNWGNCGMPEVFNHWYWSRAEIGPYNIIASEMISTKEFDNDNIVVFNISKGGKTIADKGDYVKLYRSFGKMHLKLKKDVSDDLVFVYDNPNDPYRYEYILHRKESIVEADMLFFATGGGLKYRIAKMITKKRPAYFRFTGTAEIRVYKNNEFQERHISESAIWELMYFGHPNGK